MYRILTIKLPVNILLIVRRRYFFCRSVIFILSCVCYAFVRVCLFVPCGHLLGKDWPLGSRVWCLIVRLSLSHWYLGSGVVLDCIDSWSLHPYLLSLETNLNKGVYWHGPIVDYSLEQIFIYKTVLHVQVSFYSSVHIFVVVFSLGIWI